MRFSVVIATKGRPEILAATLAGLERCDPKPEELVVVDGDQGGSARAAVARLAEGHAAMSVRYLQTDAGSSVQRNHGLREAAGDVVVFLDDDVDPDPGLFAALAQGYADPSIAGATGTVIEHSGRRFGDKRSPLRLLLGRRGEGRMTRFGYPRRLREQGSACDVEFMQGCLMSARRELASRVGFDERLEGYGLAEDEDFSYRLSRIGRVRHLPAARVVHRNLGFLTRNPREFNRKVVVNRTYLFRKNFDRGILARAEFALFFLALVAHRALNREWQGIAGLGEGALEAWRGR